MATQLLESPELQTIRRTHTFARPKHKHTMIQEPHDDHFTSEDRKALTEISVHMSYVRDAIESMKNTSTRIDTKMETLHDQTNKKMETTNDKLEARIRILENWRWWVMGAAVAGGGVGGMMARLLGH